MQANVRADVWATYEAEKYWKQYESNHLFAWRYLFKCKFQKKISFNFSLTLKDYDWKTSLPMILFHFCFSIFLIDNYFILT
jgi:hypothetical protein